MSTTDHLTEALIEADAEVPLIRITRDFRATVNQLRHAHTDPDIFVQWIGPDSVSARIDYWDARTGGSWRYAAVRGEDEIWFHGSFHQVHPHRIVQTFTWEGQPDGVALETMRMEDLGDGWTRLHIQSLVDSFEGRDSWLNGGMATGVNEGYAALDRLLAEGRLG